MSSETSRLFSSSSYLTFPPDINRRVPLTLLRFSYNVLPVYALYYLTAALVQRPGTRLLRVAIAPLTLTLAYVAGTAFDVSGGNPRYAYLSFGQTVSDPHRNVYFLELMSKLLVDYVADIYASHGLDISCHPS